MYSTIGISWSVHVHVPYSQIPPYHPHEVRTTPRVKVRSQRPLCLYHVLSCVDDAGADIGTRRRRSATRVANDDRQRSDNCSQRPHRPQLQRKQTAHTIVKDVLTTCLHSTEPELLNLTINFPQLHLLVRPTTTCSLPPDLAANPPAPH